MQVPPAHQVAKIEVNRRRIVAGVILGTISGCILNFLQTDSPTAGSGSGSLNLPLLIDRPAAGSGSVSLTYLLQTDGPTAGSGSGSLNLPLLIDRPAAGSGSVSLDILQANHVAFAEALNVPGIVFVGILSGITACIHVIVGLVAVQVVLRVALHPHDRHAGASLWVNRHGGDAPYVASLCNCSCSKACDG